MDFFENYAIVAMPSANDFFYAFTINKGDIRLQFEGNKFFHQVAPTFKNQLKYFSNTNNSTTLTPLGPSRVSKEAKLSTEFEFGSLVC